MKSNKERQGGGLTDDEYDTLNEDMAQTAEKAHRKYGHGGSRKRKDIEILSVEQMLRKDSGHYGVSGIIVGVSSVEHVVVSTEFGCSDCMKRTRRKGKGEKVSYEIPHDPPLFSLPYNYSLNYKPKECPSCESLSFGPKSHKEKAVVRIQLQDEEKQNNLENLTVVLFEDDTLNIRNGEKVIVFGDVKIIQQQSQNSKRVTYLFAREGKLRYERPENTRVTISKRDMKLMYRLVKQPDYIEKLTKMFAPTIIGEITPKLGVIVMYVGAPETEDFRGRIHGLFVGPPGTAKSKLGWQAKKLGEPNSRYSSMEGSSGQALGVIIDKEGDSYIARSGILVQAKGSMCVLNEVGALSEDDQKHLFSVMEEGIIPKDKYGLHKEIEAKTTILGTLNPRRSEWYYGNISKDQIPLRRELVDRYDLPFAFKDTSGKYERQKYGYEKLAILERSLKSEIDSGADYIFLRKIIQHAKTFNPTEVTEEARTAIVEFFSDLDVKNFPTRRVLDVATRVSMAFARLHFSEVVTYEIAKKALDFIADVYRDFDNTVVVIEDPRELVCKEIADFYLQRPNMTYDFADTVQVIKARSSMLETYLGDGKGLDTQGHKYRDLRERFLESPPVSQGLIIIENQNPLRLMFKLETKVKPSYKASDKDKQHSDIEQSNISISSSYEQLITEEYLAGPKQTIYKCKDHPDVWNISKEGLVTCHFIPFHEKEKRNGD